MQIGEKFGEETGRVIGSRVLPDVGHGPRVEISFQASGKLFGIETNNLGTYESTMRPAGVLFGEGQGVAMTKDGDSISWRANGLGRPTGKGMAVAWRATVYYQTTSQKLARLNNTIGVVEFETDENGTTKGSSWELR